MEADLQFEKAEYERANSGDDYEEGPFYCAACKRELTAYYEVRGKDFCPTCTEGLRLHLGTPSKRFWAASARGGGVAALGLVVYYLVLRVTGYNLALVTIFIGAGVGIGVRKGSRGIGGRGYQFLAMGLTYLAITGTYYIMILELLAQKGHLDPFTVVVGFFIAMISPFLALPANIIGLCIIAFGLWEAWKFTRIPKLVIEGPFDIEAPTPDVA